MDWRRAIGDVRLDDTATISDGALRRDLEDPLADPQGVPYAPGTKGTGDSELIERP